MPSGPRGRGRGGRGGADGAGRGRGGWDGPPSGGGDAGWGGPRKSGGGWPDAPQQNPNPATGWGKSFGGESWDSAGAAGGSNQAGPSAAPAVPPPADPSLDWGAPALDWGAPSADWGASSSAPASAPPADWGAPPPAPGSWGNPSSTSTDQQSPDQEKKAAEAAIWGDPAKEKDANVTSTPQWATPRTPRSPDRSPQRERVAAADPRRRPSLATSTSTTAVPSVRATSPSDEAAQSILAKELRKEETRTLSWGVPAPVSVAGPSGSTPSPSPFAFTDYTPAQRMDVEPPEPVEDLFREVNMEEIPVSSRAGSKVPSRASSPISPVVDGRLKTSLDKWKDFTRLLTKAVALGMDLATLNETQAKQRAMQRSSRYRSASMVVAHAQIERVRAEHDGKLRRTQRKFDECLAKLAAFPTDGPPTEADPVLPPEIENWHYWANSTKAWIDEVRPLVEQRLETERTTAQLKQEEEEAKAAEEEATAKEMEEAQARVELVNSQVDSLEDQVTDLEHQIEELRMTPTGTADIVATILRSRKDIVLPSEPLAASRSTEEGEVPLAPRKTQAQLTAEVAQLERELEGREARLEELLKQIEEEKGRNLERKRAYHQLAAETAELQLQMNKLTEQRKTLSEGIAESHVEIANLHKQLQEYLNREPPPPPPAPTSNELAVHVIPLLRPELRGALHDGLGAVRRGVDEALARQQQDICEQVYAAFQPIMRLIQRVGTMTNHQPGMFMPPPPPPVQSLQHS
ncbi:uncharacterized protein TRAVEDRAFT_45339 [Trametes versicolor FP-101664 SS1]|uniref:uncharacterized protein n=1 Tax=Trametes versicolor (strain FP-101664) TaxID=717944 RepID=UPI0004624825|nr:uncharacterized protein TRAVEDRAFT_45339 [Trametes versicolor FP-101664 SS1]EIW60090.1 hypothetical protein TRAVEDRAFT_45339 [Trametes versicolor FP-101664 SS1]